MEFSVLANFGCGAGCCDGAAAARRMLQLDENSGTSADGFRVEVADVRLLSLQKNTAGAIPIPQRRERELLFVRMPSRKQIPSAKTACGMTVGAFFCKARWPRRRSGSKCCEQIARRLFQPARRVKIKMGTRGASPHRGKYWMTAAAPPWPA